MIRRGAALVVHGYIDSIHLRALEAACVMNRSS